MGTSEQNIRARIKRGSLPTARAAPVSTASSLPQRWTPVTEV